MFVGTHIPMASTPDEPPVPDKLIHFVMYAVLGLLLPLWSGWDVPLTFRRVLTLLGGLTGYAAVDEWLQIPVGRTAEWWDWVADAGGAASGLALASLVQWVSLRLGQNTPH